jgi:hypothetical protein
MVLWEDTSTMEADLEVGIVEVTVAAVAEDERT